MKNLSIMIKPASSGCNMRCTYCFYADVSQQREVKTYGHMDTATMHQVLNHILSELSHGDHLSFAFQGGEPTLVGLPFYEEFVSYVRLHRPEGVSIAYALQTNGYLLDEHWCAFLSRHHFLVGLSWDGPPSVHNAQRLDVCGKGTYQKVLQAKNQLEKAGVDYNILTVLTNELARHPNELWRFIREQKLQYVQLIPCLGSLDGTPQQTTLTPERYASFYCKLFDLWLEAYQNGTYISIKLFDDYIRLLAFGECNACGLLGFCTSQIVVEADGSVYPCDFFVLDAYKAGTLATQSLKEVYVSEVMAQFPSRERPKNPDCPECPFVSICGGGCPRMHREVFSPAKNGTCGHRLFLQHAIEPMTKIARQIRVHR